MLDRPQGGTCRRKKQAAPDKAALPIATKHFCNSSLHYGVLVLSSASCVPAVPAEAFFAPSWSPSVCTVQVSFRFLLCRLLGCFGIGCWCKISDRLAQIFMARSGQLGFQLIKRDAQIF